LTSHGAAGPIGICEDPVSDAEEGSGRAAIGAVACAAAGDADGLRFLYQRSSDLVCLDRSEGSIRALHHRATSSNRASMTVEDPTGRRGRREDLVAFETERSAGTRARGSGPLELDEYRVRRTVQAARAGDRAAMRKLYERHAPSVYAYALRIVKEPHDAEDVTQQVFTKLLTGLHRYRPGEARFGTWVRQVAHNAAIDHLRARRTSECLREDEACHDDATEHARLSLQAALATLPTAQREVLLLTHVAGLSPREIAARLGTSVRSVHGLHYRGRAAAQVALHDLGVAPCTSAAAGRREWRAAGHELEAVPA
jgi:RNA polymerase sigma-70 factor (ECF subfamily)